MNKRISLVLFFAILFLLITSCGGDDGYSHAELSIPLPDSFYKTEQENFDAAFTDGESVAAIMRISFEAAIKDGIPGSLTPTEFGRYWLKQCERGSDLKNENGVTYSVYYDGSGYFYLESFFRSEYAYFIVLFAGDREREEPLLNTFLSYAGGVRISNAA